MFEYSTALYLLPLTILCPCLSYEEISGAFEISQVQYHISYCKVVIFAVMNLHSTFRLFRYVIFPYCISVTVLLTITVLKLCTDEISLCSPDYHYYVLSN